MMIKLGQFGRFWNDDDDGYAYGYFSGIMEGPHHYVDHLDIGWEHFEPADPQPQWPTRRRVIKDRAKLCRVLLDMGYVPDEAGNFHHAHKGGQHIFISSMWELCGEEVKKTHDGYRVGIYHFRPKWTEEY